MTDAPLPNQFWDVVAAVQRVLEAFSQQGVIIGGIAASLLGEPRTTADVDAMILVSTDELPQLLEAANRQGLIPRISNAESFARKNRVLLLRHVATGIEVDISLGLLPFEVETIERSFLYDTGDLEIRLPTPEDLIIQKAVAHRPKDLIDIAAIATAHPKLDWERIRHWVGQFAEALEMPELWGDIAKYQPKARKKKK